MDHTSSMRRKVTISGKATATLFGNCLLIHITVTVFGLICLHSPSVGMPIVVYGGIGSLYFLLRFLGGRMARYPYPQLGLWQQLALYGMPLYGLPTLWVVLSVVDRVTR